MQKYDVFHLIPKFGVNFGIQFQILRRILELKYKIYADLWNLMSFYPLHFYFFRCQISKMTKAATNAAGTTATCSKVDAPPASSLPKSLVWVS